MRTAIIHDWLTTFGGAERALEALLEIFPDSAVYTIVDSIPEEARDFLRGATVKTSFLQRFPFVKSQYRQYLPLMPLAIEQFDLTGYDLIISSSHAVAKGVITGPDQYHLCYCHTPIRYAWDLQTQYLHESHLESGLKSWLARLMLHYVRLWDSRTANGVDMFVANSNFVSKRIRKAYGREARVIYPPVNIDSFPLYLGPREDFFLTASRLVPYKKVDLIVEAFNSMPGKKLVVVGDGPDLRRIARTANSNVQILGYQNTPELVRLMQRARGFIFAAEEDFGIVPVEAQACGTPVIAYGRGGATESVVPGVTGMLFGEQTAGSISQAVESFEACERDGTFKPETIRRHAERFSKHRFQAEILSLLDEMPTVTVRGDTKCAP